MKVQVFKNLIKEAVREAVREELHAVLNEQTQPLKESKTFSFTSEDVRKSGLPMDARNSLRSKMGMAFGFEQPSTPSVSLDTNNKNPYLNFIADAANNMSPHDLAGLRNLD
jgi:hypothetical protein